VLEAVIAAAVDHWTTSGLSDAQLAALDSITFTVADMPGRQLGSAAGSHMTLDADAAGYGWFLDPSAGGHDISNDRADGKMDLLTVVTHELGHLLGLDHDQHDHHGVMAAELPIGTRRLLEPTDAGGSDLLFDRLGRLSTLTARDDASAEIQGATSETGNDVAFGSTQISQYAGLVDILMQDLSSTDTDDDDEEGNERDGLVPRRHTEDEFWLDTQL
jgi:hypothetical protein